MDRNGIRILWLPIAALVALLGLAYSIAGTAWLLPIVVGACVGGVAVWLRRAQA